MHHSSVLLIIKIEFPHWLKNGLYEEIIRNKTLLVFNIRLLFYSMYPDIVYHYNKIYLVILIRLKAKCSNNLAENIQSSHYAFYFLTTKCEHKAHTKIKNLDDASNIFLLTCLNIMTIWAKIIFKTHVYKSWCIAIFQFEVEASQILIYFICF